MIQLATQSKAHSHIERGDDLYETPPEAVHALLRVEQLPLCVWEPACGPGAIVNVLRQHGHVVFASDIKDYGCSGSHQHDFLQAFGAVDCILTNPPFKIIQPFIEHALKLAPKVIMLARLALLESERRTPILEGGRLRKVYVFRNRLPMFHRHGWQGPKLTNSAMAFAWFVWGQELPYYEPPTLHRISWEKL